LNSRTMATNPNHRDFAPVDQQFRRNRIGSKLQVIGLIYAKDPDAVCSKPTPEGTHTT
jgi:hypothetical protein